MPIGQRKGIKISSKEPLYVIDIRAKDNSIIVGPQDCLNIKELYLRDTNLLSDTKVFNEDIFIKVRSTGKLIKAKVILQNNSANVKILENEKGISPAVKLVFSILEIILAIESLGGGWINKTTNKNLST